ncbi:MAG TPA: hypothetical protein VIU61_25460 [Kofleriaceae bacterium]
MYRNDHDAALARIAALEADLARERSDDAAREDKLAKLQAALVKERAELGRLEAEVQRLRPAKPKPALERPPEPSPAPAANGMSSHVRLGLFFTMMGLLIVIAAASRCGKRKKDVEAPPPLRIAKMPDAIEGLWAEGQKRAAEVLPGGRLVTMTAKGVTETGELHPSYGELVMEFQADLPPPSEPRVDPSVPIGAAPPIERSTFDDYECKTLRHQSGEWTVSTVTMCILGDLYKGKSGLEPRCTTASIWQRALLDGAPSGAIAELRLDRHSWRFEIRDQRASFDKTYPDDCE